MNKEEYSIYVDHYLDSVKNPKYKGDNNERLFRN